MRFLATPNQFQLRLGWLSFIAARLDAAPVDGPLKQVLEQAFEEIGTTQDHWLEVAGLFPQTPLGRLSKRAAPDLARMAAAYGVRAPDADELTDLGHLLCTVDYQWPGVSIFQWPVPRGYLGLVLVVETWGDVFEALLQTAPEGAELEAAPWLKAAWQLLIPRAQTEDLERLGELLERLDGPVRAQNALTWPHFEPLRELGYLERAHDYRWTPAGLALLEAARRLDMTTPGWSRRNLQTLYLAGLGRTHQGPAPLEPIRRVLLNLPVGLLRATGQEAPLAAVVHLARCHLMANGDDRLLDLDDVAERLAVLGEVAGGRIGLKRGTETGAHNIAWTDEDILGDEASWREAPPPPPVVEPIPPPPSFPLTAAGRLWLQYVFSLLDPERRSALAELRYGGIDAWLDELGELLPAQDNKRDPGKNPWPSWRNKGEQPVAMYALDRSIQEMGLQDRRLPPKTWALTKNENDKDRPPLPALGFARDAWRSFGVIGRVTDFLASAWQYDWDAWAPIAEMTRALIDDLVQAGTWERGALLQALLHLEKQIPEADWISEIERLLQGQDNRSFQLLVEFGVHPEVVASVREPNPPFLHPPEPATVEVGPSRQDGHVTAFVDVEAPTAEQARKKGLAWAHDALARLTFRAGSTASTFHPGPEVLQDEEGQVVTPPEPETPSDLDLIPGHYGFLAGAPSVDLSLLPPLAALDRGKWSARERLTAALHWLQLGQQHRSPAERLGHAWIAVEHLISADQTTKIGPVMERLSAAMALVHLEGCVGSIWRASLAGLHARACRSPEDAGLLSAMETLFGPEARDIYAGREPGIASAVGLIHESQRLVSDRAALEVAIEHRNHLATWSQLLLPEWPLAAWRLSTLAIHLRSLAGVVGWMEALRRSAAAFLLHVYHVRNRLVHEARPFAFEQASRLDDLQQQFRSAADPAIRLLLKQCNGGVTLDEVWDDLQERLRFLEDEKNSTSPIAPVETLFQYLPP